MVDILYKTKRGGSMIKRVSNMESVAIECERLFKSRTPARCRKDGEIVGKVYKEDGRWDWWCETDAMQREEKV